MTSHVWVRNSSKGIPPPRIATTSVILAGSWADSAGDWGCIILECEVDIKAYSLSMQLAIGGNDDGADDDGDYDGDNANDDDDDDGTQSGGDEGDDDDAPVYPVGPIGSH